jgi:hypothetical protein
MDKKMAYFRYSPIMGKTITDFFFAVKFTISFFVLISMKKAVVWLNTFCKSYSKVFAQYRCHRKQFNDPLTLGFEIAAGIRHVS